jgi:hypothetical protein
MEAVELKYRMERKYVPPESMTLGIKKRGE